MSSTITATDLAKNLSDILNRVRYKGEEFVIIRNGEAVAVIKPELPAPKPYTGEDFLRDFGHVKMPEGFADALEEGRSMLRESREPDWPP